MGPLRATLLAAALAACYAPSAPSGVPCENGACPTGQSCLAGVCVRPGDVDADSPDDGTTDPDGPSTDAPLDAGPDADGDGVLDGVDNCPANANPTQHDEDGDLRGDACDLCPHFATAIDPDTDGDTVGDACDPLPTATERIVRFESFEAGIPTDWSADGTWTAAADTATVTAVDGDRFALAPPEAALASAVVVAQVTPTAHDGLDSRGIGISMPMERMGAGAGIACELVYNSGSTNPRLAIVDLGAGVFLSTGPYNWALGDTYVLTLTRVDTMFTCMATGPNGNRTLQTTSAVALPMPAYGLRSKGMTGTFDYLVLINQID